MKGYPSALPQGLLQL